MNLSCTCKLIGRSTWSAADARPDSLVNVEYPAMNRAGTHFRYGAVAITVLAIATAITTGARADELLRLAQVTTNPATTTTAPSTPAPPSANSTTSATCLSGCSSQSFNCQNTCISTVTGATVVPSITTVGTTSSPGQCQQNCSTQLQACQRNCSLQ